MTGRYEVVGQLGENFYPRAVFSGHGGSRELAKILCDEHRDAVALAAVADFAARVGAFFEANDPDAGLGISILIQAFASGERKLP